MTRILVAALLVFSACARSETVTSTFTSTDQGPLPSLTTTIPVQEVEIQDCSSPPVTFAPLCEIYDLLETWYVDAPVDPVPLADLAVRGLTDFTTLDTEDPPRTLFCAIPDDAFTDLCHAVAERVLADHIPVGQAVEAAMAHMIDLGLDPFTYYLPPEEVGSFRLNGIVGGIGVLLDARDAAGSKCTQITSPCRLEVVAVLEDNPGFEAGLALGDIVISVDDQPVEGRGFASVVALIAGDEAGTVAITVERAGESIDFTIERSELSVPTVQIELLGSNVGYIRIPDFEFDIPGLVSNALDELAAADPGTIVVDLRDNPGGFIDVAVEVADQFISGGVVMISDAPDEHFEYQATAGGLATSQRLVVLVNQGTASAAEILTGALRDRRDAVVVGTDTFGKDAVQIPFTLRNGGEFHVAVARWSTPGGATAGSGGLSPDHQVAWPAGATVEVIVELALETLP
ncbi:MAG TPA: S41 family peptidase [Acidimicrobiia bacterium]